MSNLITIVLSGFKRPHVLKQQFEAIKSQTVSDIDIMMWVNVVDNVQFDRDILNQCNTIISNTDYGSWGRFAVALNARTKYVCVIDDDTIPGKKWLENCLKTLETHNGILSTRGVIAHKGYDLTYPAPKSYTAVGWCNPNEETVIVDMGCHSWFFEKNWLRAFWAEMPDINPMRYGEDTHLSFAVKRHFGLNTYVPPHPKGDMDMWGSMPETALKYGEEPVAISMDYHANIGMNRYWNFVRQMGYTIAEEESEKEQNEIHNATE
jgi:cellulose synthase/poly-beta-1,6-N-acetylglucosamine synthase-like glycosyltransferase